MSELINSNNNRLMLRRQLLITASTLALLTSTYVPDAFADDGDQKTIWIELGGQLEQLSGQGEAFAPPFLAVNSNSPVFKPISPSQAEKAPLFSYGAEGKVSFEPANTSWVFSAAMRYGRSSDRNHVHEQSFPVLPTTTPPIIFSHYNGHAFEANYADTVSKHQESHIVLDFQAGRDVGMGMFGKEGTSVLSLGVRYAQFSSNRDVGMSARPNLEFYRRGSIPFPLKYFHNYLFEGNGSRSFHGVGPSLSWNASAPVAGHLETAEIKLDWGINAAMLFGRQKENSQHKTTGRKRYQLKSNCCSHVPPITSNYVTVYKHSAHNNRIRSVTVPNFGGFAALSIQRANAKVSFGYRADFFLGALDGGIDTRKSETLGFKGPYATISVGIGG
jgi:iron complex outermembrane receptor protein